MTTCVVGNYKEKEEQEEELQEQEQRQEDVRGRGGRYVIDNLKFPH